MAEQFKVRTSAFKGTNRTRTRSTVSGRAAKKTAAAALAKGAVIKPKKNPAKKSTSGSNRAVVVRGGAGVREPDLSVTEGSETVEIELKVKDGELVIRVLTSRDDDWEPLAEDVVKQGIELILERQSQLERAAARFGLATELLLTSLEDAVVDVSDESGGLPEAERAALDEAGIKLQGHPEDPTGVGEVMKGLALFERFRADALSVAQAAKVLDKTEGRVRQLVTAGQLATISNGEAGYRLPSWQFNEGRIVPSLSTVLEHVGSSVHPLTLAGFMMRADPDLEVDGMAVSPVQWLVAGGDAESVADLAADLGVFA